jgi:hypothetical protein
MRTLIQTTIRRRAKDKENTVEQNRTDIERWLKDSGFSPQLIIIPEDWQTALLDHLSPTETEKVRLREMPDTSLSSTIELMFSIPLEDRERRRAIKTFYCSLEFYDLKHTTHVPGMVCLDGNTVITRFRHSLSRTLELTTEIYVDKIREQAGTGGTFIPFIENHSISVREPLSTHDAYVGIIKPTNEQIKKRALKDKRFEYNFARWAICFSLILIILGFGFFTYAALDDDEPWFVAWLSGFCDRLASAVIMSGLLSYLGYRFYKSSLKSKPSIEWQ